MSMQEQSKTSTNELTKRSPPKISIVTASYNNLDGIKLTAASVRSQTYRNFEHLIIDGGSKDGTVEWLEENASDRLDSITEADSGIYDAMNKGLRLSSGDLVLFLNGGDTLADPSALEYVAASWEEGNWDWGYGILRYVDDQRRPIRTYVQQPFSRQKTARGLAFAPHPTTFVSRSSLIAAGGFDLAMGFSADQDMAVRISEGRPPVVWLRIISDYLIVGAHSTSSFRETALRYRKIRQKNGLLVLRSGAADAIYTNGITGAWKARALVGQMRRRVSRSKRMARGGGNSEQKSHGQNCQLR